MKSRSQGNRSFDDLDLTIETLKDLTPTDTQSDQVRGGPTTKVGRFCECGSM